MTEQRHPGADRRGHSGDGQDRCVGEGEQVAGDRLGALRIGVAEEDDELVTARADKDVVATEAVAPLGDQVTQDVVTGAVTEGVVHVLEVIDVEKHERAAGGVGRLGRKTARKLHLESPAIVSACQGVPQGEVLEVGLQAVTVGHVQHLGHEVQGPVLLVADKGDAHDRVHHGTVGP